MKNIRHNSMEQSNHIMQVAPKPEKLEMQNVTRKETDVLAITL